MTVADTRTDTPSHRPLLAVPEGSQILRLVPALAEEMGHLQKALVLTQVAFWIGRSKIYRDGHFWARLSIRWMQRYAFKFWTPATINRWITRLVEDGYLIEGNYNRRPNDQTRWLALNPEGLARLKSVAVIWQELFRNDTTLFRNDTTLFRNDTGLYRNDTNQESESKNQSKEGNQESSDPTPHPDDDEDSDPEDKKHSMQSDLDPAGRFGPIPESLTAGLQAQLDRLGIQTARDVVERCKASGGRTWTYVHTALANQSTPATPSEVARLDDPEPAPAPLPPPTFKRPPMPVTARTAHPWRQKTVRDAWQLTCIRLEQVLDRAIYDRLIDTASLVDFVPGTGTFIVVVDWLYPYKSRDDLHLNVIYHELRKIYGDGPVDIRFLTRTDWLMKHSPAQPQGATA